MFKKLALVTCFIASSLFTMSASAGVIVDVVEQTEYVGWFGSHSYTHDINDNGFSLGSAVSATLAIDIWDDGGRWDFGEIILVKVEEFDFDTGGVLFSATSFYNDVEFNALGALNLDGMLDVSIKSLWGDFYVGDSTLTVNVPEPGTMIILGLALVGFTASRRRIK